MLVFQHGLLTCILGKDMAQTSLDHDYEFFSTNNIIVIW
jgi:hypothetical protein